MCTLLNELFERGRFKKLHLNLKDIDKESIDRMASIQGFERLSVKEVNEITAQFLTSLTNLRELSILDCKNIDWDEVATGLTKLEKLFIQNANYEHMLTFIRRSTNLKLIKVLPKDKAHFNGGAINLVALNAERRKLPNARKIVIYIEDNVFLATKWSTDYGDTNLSHIEMKRSKSLCWDYDCSMFRTMH